MMNDLNHQFDAHNYKKRLMWMVRFEFATCYGVLHSKLRGSTLLPPFKALALIGISMFWPLLQIGAKALKVDSNIGSIRPLPNGLKHPNYHILKPRLNLVDLVDFA